MIQPHLKSIIDSPDFDDQIETLSVVELEELILHIESSGDGTDEQMWDCVSARDHLLYKQWTLTDTGYEHLRRVDAMAMAKIAQTMRDANRLFNHLKTLEIEGFYGFTITISVFPRRIEEFSIEHPDDGSGSNYLAMANILSYKAYHNPSIVCFQETMSHNYGDDEKEDISYYDGEFYADHKNHHFDDWYFETFFHDPEMERRGRFFTSYAMHSLLTHSFAYSPQDVIRIEAFDANIMVEYEAIRW